LRDGVDAAAGPPVREISFGDAIREALAEEMRRDARIVLLGEDVAEAGTPFKVVKGLVEEFGKERIIDTPISEAGFTGLAVGAAMTGLRPVVDIMFGDFMTLVMDQVVNQAAKIHYMSGGKWKVPMVVRATMGATRRSAAQHSQSLHAWPSHIPGLKVVVPSTPYDAKGLLKSAIRDDNPVVFFEDKISYAKVKGPVPAGEYTIPLGVADVKREGRDITLVAGGARRSDDARRDRDQRRGRRSTDDVAARREDPGRVGPEDVACARHRRGVFPLRRHW
jgi:pyruvate dehydrogenase E1 component beta subunit